MKKNTLILFLFIALASFSVSAQKINLQLGNYSAFLQLNETTQLPVRLTVEEKQKKTIFVINNAEERIELVYGIKKGDSIILNFPNFDSELHFITYRKSKILGYWFNYNKGKNYKIPFYAQFNSKHPKDESVAIDLSGKWETHFSPDTPDEETGLGIFQQNNNKLTGTIRTETGDYRYMEGKITGNNFYLSAFDGSHAFLLKGSQNSSKLTGFFYSGKHYSTSFSAQFNPDFELRNPDSITTLSSNQLSFKFKDLHGKDYVYPNKDLRGKVVIIQIMGTWCPNCMDETNFYKELYDLYHDKGLEILSVGYEYAETFEEQAKKIETLKTRKNLDFTFLVGGKASKDLASKDFSALNEIISFPTSIFIGRDGQVKRIHTGFNGPSTHGIYTEYVEKTKLLVESLLKN